MQQPRPSVDPNDPLVLATEEGAGITDALSQNWSKTRKYINFALVCAYVLFIFALYALEFRKILTGSSINMITVIWGDLNEDLGFSYAALNDTYAIGCAALCIGGLFLIPFAMKFGRRPLYLLSLIAECGIAIWTARMETVADLWLVNFFSCFVGALCEVMAQMSVADMFFVHERGTMNAIYVWVLNLSASLAPLAAGYIATGQGWRWVWWWTTIFLGATSIIFFFFYDESMYSRNMLVGVPEPPVQTAHERTNADEEKHVALGLTQNLTRMSNDEPGQSSVDHSIKLKTYRERLSLWTTSNIPWSQFFRHCYQPFVIMFYIPPILYMAIFNGAIYSANIIQVTTISSYLPEEPYLFSSDQVGLMGLPAFIGATIGSVLSGPLSDYMILRLSKRNEGIYEPEMRLWLILGTAPFILAGLILFGIAIDQGKSWIIIAIGYALASFGTAVANVLSLAYLIDAYGEVRRLTFLRHSDIEIQIISECMVGVTFFKNLFPTIFVFALTPWIVAQGLTKVYIVLAILVAGTIFIGSAVLLVFGKRSRKFTAFRYEKFVQMVQSTPV